MYSRSAGRNVVTVQTWHDVTMVVRAATKALVIPLGQFYMDLHGAHDLKLVLLHGTT